MAQRSYTSKTVIPKGITADTPVQELSLIGPAYGERLERLSIFTVKDLLYHFPFRYQDTRDISTISALKDKGEGTIRAEVITIQTTRTRTGKWLTQAQLTDQTGSIKATWFNQPYLTKSIQKGYTYLFSGKINTKWGISLMSPQFEKDPLSIDLFTQTDDVTHESRETTHLGKLAPVYPETYGVSSKWLRARIKQLKPHIPEIIKETISPDMLVQEELMTLPEAITSMHFGTDEKEIQKAQYRLGIDELTDIRIQALKLAQKRKRQKSISLPLLPNGFVSILLSQLPYELTYSQKQALGDIQQDLENNHPMYRLLNGDVGSGKTIVALLAALQSADNKHSTIVMAPTTILAQQHYKTMMELIEKSGIPIKMQLVTSSTSIQPVSDTNIIVGTHALLYSETLPQNIGLVIIDEQHRFGVKQRKKLTEMVSQIPGYSPHYLTMTATPIPRTLTMALYGSQNVSVLTELPPGRIPVKTFFVPQKKRKDAQEWIQKMLSRGEKVFYVCPLVEESEKTEAKSVVEEQKRLKREVFPDYSIGIIHGQMNDKEKKTALQAFREGIIQVLVATSVIEVGIDIPDATIMIIEDAERYGLAQLHQLRGRVGRGSKQAYCFLFSTSQTEDVVDRLHYFSKHTSGFEVAEYDLKRRGPGEVFGTKQSGLLSIRFADITDPKQIAAADRIARNILKIS